jgi:NAD(P)H dehydrogenase (quinone)
VIGVTGASGALARLVTAELLARTAADELVLVTRTPAALTGAQEAGTHVRHGDFDDERGLRDALRGVDRLLLVSSVVTGPRRVEQHAAAIAAARAAGVGHVVYTSFVGAVEANPAAVAADHLATERALEASGLDATFLRHSWYADVVANALAPRAVAEGRWTMNTGEGQVAPVAKEDAARVAAAVLTGEGHAGRAYDVTGPELTTVGELADAAGVPYDDVDDAVMLAGFEAAGVPRATDLVSFGRAIREGWMAVRSDDVETLTGRPARPVREMIREAVER